MPACGGGRAERSRARDERGRGDDDDPNSSPPEHARVGEGRFPRPSVRRARASVHHSGGGAADLNHAVLIVVVVHIRAGSIILEARPTGLLFKGKLK